MGQWATAWHGFKINHTDLVFMYLFQEIPNRVPLLPVSQLDLFLSSRLALNVVTPVAFLVSRPGITHPSVVCMIRRSGHAYPYL